MNLRKPSRKTSLNVKQFAQVIVKRDALRIKLGTYTAKIVPVGIQLGQFSGGASVHFAPMWAAMVALEDLFDSVKVTRPIHQPRPRCQLYR